MIDDRIEQLKKAFIFIIQCKDCLENISIRDGYNNEDVIDIKIIGESIIEISYKSCENSITTIDGDVY